jgi:sortase (surface protein transpeptidase)
MFAAAVGHRSGRATPSLRDAPQRQSMEIVGRETIYRNRNAVQTNPATSPSSENVQNDEVIGRIFNPKQDINTPQPHRRNDDSTKKKKHN